MTPEQQPQPMLETRALTVRLGGQEILHQIDLTVRQGELMTLLGPSGCGKSTLLKAVAGLLEPDGGDVRIGGRSVTGLPTEKRGAVIVFQDLRLFPHMSVAGNIEFSLKLRGIPRSQRTETVRRLLEVVRLPGMEARRVSQLSGGQMQRVALARALAAQPRLLLLDEPFSSLDEGLRREMDDFVQELHRQSNITILMVTHDKGEALSISDRIALMIGGQLVQVDVPEAIYRHPALQAAAPGCPDGRWTARIRPGTVRLLEEGPWEVTRVRYQGESSLVSLRLDDSTLTALTGGPVPVGTQWGVSIDAGELQFFPTDG